MSVYSDFCQGGETEARCSSVPPSNGFSDTGDNLIERSAVASSRRSAELEEMRDRGERLFPMLICEVATNGHSPECPSGHKVATGAIKSSARGHEQPSVVAPLVLLLNTQTDMTRARSAARGFGRGAVWSIPGGRTAVSEALFEAARQASQPVTRRLHRAVVFELCGLHPELTEDLLRVAGEPSVWTEDDVPNIRALVRITPGRGCFDAVKQSIERAHSGGSPLPAIAAVEEVARRATDDPWREAAELVRDIERLSVGVSRETRLRTLNALEELKRALADTGDHGKSGGHRHHGRSQRSRPHKTARRGRPRAQDRSAT